MARDVYEGQASSVLPAGAGDAPQSPRAHLAQQMTAQGDVGGSIFSQFANNPFFTAGFGLAALGVAARVGQKGLKHGASLLRRRLLVDVEITRHDASYHWFLNWMTAYQQARLNPHAGHEAKSVVSRILQKLTPSLHHLQMQTHQTKLPNGTSLTRFSLVPGPGYHILRYRNAFIAIHRHRDGPPDLQTGQPFETIKLTTLFSHRHIFQDLFKEAHDLVEQTQEGKTIIYRPEMTNWVEFGQPKRKRPLESVVLARGVKENLVDDIQNFMASRNWYLDRGIPYRRGYLLYGPPGTGKSSFIQALAGYLDYNIAMLHLSERGLTDDRLAYLLNNVPQRTIVLLEDADSAFANRQSTGEDGYRGMTVTFSGLLNALDGVASADERIIFMTTNHVDRLDGAIIRPGRVDLTLCLDNASQWQIEGLWERFYATQDPNGDIKVQFMKQIEKSGLEGQVSTAALQGLFLVNKEDPSGAVKMVDALRPQRRVPQTSKFQEAG